MKKRTRITLIGAVVLIALFSIQGIYKNDYTKSAEKAAPSGVKSSTIQAASTPAALDPAQKLLKTLTLEEKIGQLVIVGFPQGAKEAQIREYIEKDKVSGFILFKRNYKNFEELYHLNRNLKTWNSKNPLPLFLSVDEEGGTVSRIPTGGTKFPDARKIGMVDDAALTQKTGEVIGRELHGGGINLNYAPVLDILTKPQSTLLKMRTYGTNAEAVSRHGLAFIKGLQSHKVIAVPKHFPGHGDTDVDSHGKLPVIGIDKNTLIKRELIPFKNAVDSGLDAIMVGHLAFPKIDPSGLPASMSRVFLTDLLRKELGFEGIAITDEIEMYGFMNGKASLEESVVTAFNAGADVFVVGHTKGIQDRVIKTLRDGVAKGSISKERLDESVLRIIRVKQKYGLEDTMEMGIEEAKKVFGSLESREVLRVVNRKINEL